MEEGWEGRWVVGAGGLFHGGAGESRRREERDTVVNRECSSGWACIFSL